MAGSSASIQEEVCASFDKTAVTHSNLRCFLHNATPVVKAHKVPMIFYLPLSNNYYGKVADEVKCFYLGDLWNVFYKWSACGVGTSVCIAPCETIEQYFVPYLSAIELYTNKTNDPTSQSMVYDRRFYEYNQHLVKDQVDFHGHQVPSHMANIGGESKGELFFKYFEHDSPYERIPFIDKVHELYNNCPSIASLTSAELSPSSWMSVFWYPTSHVPMKNRKDLNTCFLTYHSLSTSQDNHLNRGNASNSNHVALAPFGLATYKLDAKVWASPNSGDQKHIACLYDAAQSWLKKHGIYHYDFNFFSASCSSTRT
ncbi:hypothetical protein HU200_031536 [Digitaria exilis]|uniref:Uncharacterized protein n=1 Tax=Digitaria exilis TaxID=1010633 RepID=A0A835BQD0_9POAL|nr:hypothetical protein HU200_031536 [Digitaria exilis]